MRSRLSVLSLLGLFSLSALAGSNQVPVELGSRRLLFVDDHLIARLEGGMEMRLHPPRRRETVFTFNAPWDGTRADFYRLIRLGDVIRLYYLTALRTYDAGLKNSDEAAIVCLLESLDGIHWVRPDLGLFSSHDSKHNDIVWVQPRLDNFTPFRDANPACAPEERFKAVGHASPLPGQPRELFAYKSPDGLHWSFLSSQPLFSSRLVQGLAFDSENNAFWDPVRKHYWCYMRGFHYRNGEGVTDLRNGTVGIRDIRVATSNDFRTWSTPRRIEYGDDYDPQLYTNQIEPYSRAPDLLIGFPTRYSDRRDDFTPGAMAALPDPTHRQRRMVFNPRYGTAVTDGLFMTSHDGYSFHRWGEAFIPPGPERHDNWIYGDGYQSLGLIETDSKDPASAPELSCYAYEGRWREGMTMRRYTMRIDGFVSLHASHAKGEVVTRPFVFSGRALNINFATSGAGAIQVEIQRADGTPLAGHALADCDVLFGDTIERTVTWGGQSDLSSVSGQPVRLRMLLREADLYSLKFKD